MYVCKFSLPCTPILTFHSLTVILLIVSIFIAVNAPDRRHQSRAPVAQSGVQVSSSQSVARKSGDESRLPGNRERPSSGPPNVQPPESGIASSRSVPKDTKLSPEDLKKQERRRKEKGIQKYREKLQEQGYLRIMEIPSGRDNGSDSLFFFPRWKDIPRNLALRVHKADKKFLVFYNDEQVSITELASVTTTELYVQTSSKGKQEATRCVCESMSVEERKKIPVCATVKSKRKEEEKADQKNGECTRMLIDNAADYYAEFIADPEKADKTDTNPPSSKTPASRRKPESKSTLSGTSSPPSRKISPPSPSTATNSVSQIYDSPTKNSTNPRSSSTISKSTKVAVLPEAQPGKSTLGKSSASGPSQPPPPPGPTIPKAPPLPPGKNITSGAPPPPPPPLPNLKQQPIKIKAIGNQGTPGVPAGVVQLKPEAPNFGLDIMAALKARRERLESSEEGNSSAPKESISNPRKMSQNTVPSRQIKKAEEKPVETEKTGDENPRDFLAFIKDGKFTLKKKICSDTKKYNFNRARDGKRWIQLQTRKAKTLTLDAGRTQKSPQQRAETVPITSKATKKVEPAPQKDTDEDDTVEHFLDQIQNGPKLKSHGLPATVAEGKSIARTNPFSQAEILQQQIRNGVSLNPTITVEKGLKPAEMAATAPNTMNDEGDTTLLKIFNNLANIPQDDDSDESVISNANDW
ncbi:hypothetical protein Ddc_16923 [Ditylenchus destructor]|nr:hypothetical protein Ddc_16923 [Ditylenchus destructor]